MAALATFVAHARSAVERDRYRREIELIPPNEMPGRLARSLRCLFHGLQAIGADEAECWKLSSQVALDSIPDVRRKALRFLSNQEKPIDTADIIEALSYPKSTTLRVLEDLTGHRLIRRFSDDKGKPHKWELSRLSIDLLLRAQITLPPFPQS
jgi:hypothetical protein